MKNRATIVLLIVISILSLVLTSCSTTTSPKTVVENFFSAVQAGEIEKAAIYVVPKDENLSDELLPPEDELDDEIAKKVFSHITYEVKSQEISGNTAKVNATITSLDLVRIVAKSMSELMPMAFAAAFSENSQENIDVMFEQYLINSISDPNAPTTTTDIVINLKKIEGKWLIVPDDNLLNSLTGNAAKAFENFN